MSRAIVVVQARMSSTRLPGKVLRVLAGAPAIVRMIERVARVRADAHVVATSEDASDDPLADVCRQHRIACVRGPLDDVLQRFVRAVPEEFDTVVRLTADCPLIDPALVDRCLAIFTREQPWAEYVTNAVVRTHPDGLDVEVFSRHTLLEAARAATAAYDREHVTPWVKRRARMVPVAQELDLSALRWTLDTIADYDQLGAIFAELHPKKPAFESRDVYALMIRRPELIRIAGKDELTRAERRAWVERIEKHLARKELDA